ncbi:TPA: transcriptional regulator [Photobacterium damselae]|uniref:transcriptional regulator n=1 Tax=Photobacterium damselae TaxID=38293 RepID=UPI0010FF3A6A|nr:YdaS family helix-turn-helix protein [Photobacterium damselae]NVH51906.1 helix-turn-helix domain-containing protein [Photobacterium damselae subsp. damselae]NVO82704.1 helix-turn-helix domain-containing protein [Photobacterium damselae subsp. damselae]TLS83832.1 helix-turn-helix domain-containing protein [Photobacterium damselae subsp. damselae]TLS91024.1 helix-turn-helix domain-containing protein [Photobacterium damselae subsp. damselae]
MSITALDKAISNCNGQTALAERINQLSKKTKKLKQSNIFKWRQLGAVPAAWVLDVEIASGVPCWELRPDIYPPERFKYKTSFYLS